MMKVYKKFFLIFSAVFFLSFLWVEYKIRSLREQTLTEYKSSSQIVMDARPEDWEEDENFHFTKMVLAIIGNYYLDADRLEFSRVLKSTLDSLKEQFDLDYTLEEDSLLIKTPSLSLNIPYSWLEDLLGRTHAVIFLSKAVESVLPDKTQDPVHETLRFLVNSLDPYSRLLTQDEYRDLKEGTNGEFGGLGIIIGMRQHLLTVLDLLPKSPAFHAGIHPMDKILSINGISTFGSDLDTLITHMKGLPGSKATISLLRDSSLAPFDLTLERKLIQIDPVSMQHLKTPEGRDVLSLKLDSFSSKSYDRILNELKKNFLNNRNVYEGVIFDLRANPGGLLDQAVKISDLLLSKGTIVTVKGKETEIEYAQSPSLNLKCPVVVLIDEDSASASEIFAGALKDHDRAITIGQPSYGKGTVQTVFELPDGQALKLTIARYLTPSGQSIQNVGVMPDIWLQPIIKQQQSPYKMGNLRYKADKIFLGEEKSETSIFQKPNFHSYYLKEQSSSKSSYEEDLAFHIIDSYHQSLNSSQKTSPTPSQLMKSFHSKISQRLKRWEGELSQFLLKNKIDWSQQEKPDGKFKLSIDKISAERSSVFLGDNVRVSFGLQNQGEALSRVSVFLRSAQRDVEPLEQLIGPLAANSRTESFIEFEIPRSWFQGQALFELGLAVNGTELPDMEKSFTLDVKERKEAVLAIRTEQSQDLDSNASTHIQIYIDNLGDTEFLPEQIKITNLSGKQLSLSQTEFTKSQAVPAKSSLELSFEVKAAKLSSQKQALKLGLSIDARNLKKSIHKIIEIKRRDIFSQK